MRGIGNCQRSSLDLGSDLVMYCSLTILGRKVYCWFLIDLAWFRMVLAVLAVGRRI